MDRPKPRVDTAKTGVDTGGTVRNGIRTGADGQRCAAGLRTGERRGTEIATLAGRPRPRPKGAGRLPAVARRRSADGPPGVRPVTRLRPVGVRPAAPPRERAREAVCRKRVLLALRLRWARRVAHQDAGMATAEYAMALLAAVGFAGVLYKIVTGGAVRSALEALVTKALHG
ncbi:DUF4244 domain-containing protein [Streptomyces sp. NPDC049954]|uniref:DUF4244 domain-containing protein n=1 Tax=Streptomyces sp. NPDC049954 TaxID=3155779 RepID=UPI003444E2A5